jgi:ER-bound oxygenase mpaB/B'/Rubber oxygenase, catalytic domain
MGRRSRNAGLDPGTQYREIYKNLAVYEFPWDLNQSLSFALFRTYAVPSIGRLLDETGAFTASTQKRYDDTVILLETPLLEGFESPDGKAAVRRINQMHRSYDISNEDMLYVLSTFVVVPKRWIDDFGWRTLTSDEVAASILYYRDLGRHLGVRGIPASYEAFAELMDTYEQQNFAFDAGARRVAESTMDLLASFYPRSAKPVIDLFSRTLMDQSLLEAFRFDDPGDFARRASRAALRARARVVAVVPPRRKPHLVRDMSRIRSYPGGFSIAQMGTFPNGCPIPHHGAEQPAAGAVG